jgi:hypothetical protein
MSLTFVPDVRLNILSQRHLLDLWFCGSRNKEFMVSRKRLYHLWPCRKLKTQHMSPFQPYLPKCSHSQANDYVLALVPLSGKY